MARLTLAIAAILTALHVVYSYNASRIARRRIRIHFTYAVRASPVRATTD